ncbi:DUF6183 family protein [Streptomyces nojiriensis]|uniref:DUF6183 family protein n=1 Tax=Streptomyces nojiriensis TaxID=66374 RepID=UPI003654181D
MSKDIDHRVAALVEADEVDFLALRREIEAQVSCGDYTWAGDFAVAAAARAAAGKDSRGRCELALLYVLQALAAHPGPESLRTLLRVPASPSAEDAGRTRAEHRLASLVARGHHIEDIARSVFTPPAASVHSPEFKASLLHELVLVSDRVGEHPALRAYAASLEAEGHPLAALPLHLLPEEDGLRRPAGAADDWSWQIPSSPSEGIGTPELSATPAMRLRAVGADLTETGGPELAATMGAAVQHWRAESNGEIAAQEFWSLDPVPADDFPAILELLPLAPWPADDTPPRLHPSTPQEMLAVLLTAAVRAPAYGLGLGVAYGRLAAWQSLAGLTGAPTGATVRETADLVRRTTWFRLGTTSRWFHQVAWDLALAALRPGGQEIAVLAATDTD